MTKADAGHSPGAGGTYSLGAVVRLTGLSPHVLRAWERRYGAVSPLRSEGGSRRYRESDVSRLRLLAAAVGAGHPIGDIAKLPDAELRRRSEALEGGALPQLRRILTAIQALDPGETERLLGLQLAALGPRGFVETVVEPLLREVGDGWQKGKLCVAAEHLASASVRNLLGASLRRAAPSSPASVILFGTLPGERHELGVLSCAAIASDLGANAIYLGPDLPVDEVAGAAATTGAAVVALGTSPCAASGAREREVRDLRRRLPAERSLWLGGTGSDRLSLPAGVERIDRLDDFEQKLLLRAFRREATASETTPAP